MRNKLATKLNMVRTQKNVSLSKLAESIGVDAAFLGHVEKGRRLVSIEVLILLAEYFDVSTDYLLGWKD